MVDIVPQELLYHTVADYAAIEISAMCRMAGLFSTFIRSSKIMAKGITITVIVLFLLIGGWFYWTYYFTYSEGSRTGFLQKFSLRGNAFKTYEGELVLQGFSAGNTVPLSAEKFYFSVVDKEVASKLSGLEGQRVIVHYQEKKGHLFWRGDSPYIVDSIRTVVP